MIENRPHINSLFSSLSPLDLILMFKVMANFVSLDFTGIKIRLYY